MLFPWYIRWRDNGPYLLYYCPLDMYSYAVNIFCRHSWSWGLFVSPININEMLVGLALRKYKRALNNSLVLPPILIFSSMVSWPKCDECKQKLFFIPIFIFLPNSRNGNVRILIEDCYFKKVQYYSFLLPVKWLNSCGVWAPIPHPLFSNEIFSNY